MEVKMSDLKGTHLVGDTFLQVRSDYAVGEGVEPSGRGLAIRQNIFQFFSGQPIIY